MLGRLEKGGGDRLASAINLPVAKSNLPLEFHVGIGIEEPRLEDQYFWALLQEFPTF